MSMRIGGIASGFDTEQMLVDLMRVERMKVDKYFRQEEALKWQRDALNTTNKTLADFILKVRNDFGLTKTTSTGTVLKNSNQNFDWVKKVSSSDDSVLDGVATSKAQEGTYNIEVTQLAKNASVMSEDIRDVLNGDRFNLTSGSASFQITTANGTADIKLKDARAEGKAINSVDDLKFEGKEMAIYINNKLVVLDEDFDSVADLADYIQEEIGDESTSGVKVSADAEGKLIFESKNDIIIGSSDTDEDGKLKLNTLLGLESKVYKAQNSIDDVVKQINNATKDNYGKVSLGLTAAYDKNSGRLMINSKEQGKDQFIKISGGTEEGVNELAKSIFGADSAIFKDAEEGGIKGENAEIKFNGNTIEQTSNNFSLFGVDYNLKSKGTTTVKVESDIDGMYNKVKEFVDDYNELIDKLNGLTKEKDYRDYRPLTKEEREAMKEKEIELWEEKAKSGLLKNDPTITRMLQSMRTSLYEKVGSDKGFDHITQIGITTGNYQSGGKLEINEEKLKKALRDNADGVMDLLFKSPSSKDSKDGGLVDRVFEDMITGMKDIVRRAGTGENASTLRNVQSNMLVDFVTKGSISVMDRDIMNIGKRIADEEMKLSMREQRYWNQFTAMEKALEQMNSQSGWLMAQLGQTGM